MKNRFAASGCALAVGLLLAGCSSNDNNAPSDEDAGDAGVVTGDDAGTYVPPVPDATAEDARSDTGGAAEAGSEDSGSAIDAPLSEDAGSIDGSTPVDAGHVDAGSDAAIEGSDAATDASIVDAGEPDGDAASPIDASTSDAAPVDAAASDAGPLPLLLGAWNFDEGSGTSSADLSGNGHPAVFVGTTSWGTGKEGTGLTLDGTTGYADVGVTLVDTTASFSVMAWASFQIVNNWQIAVSEDDVNGSLFGLKLRGDNTLANQTNNFDFDVETSDILTPGFVVAESKAQATANAWVFLAGVYDASGAGTLTFYQDSAAPVTATLGQTLAAASGHFLIGRGLYNGAKGSFLDGTIDEVAVYGGALTAAQIAAIHASQM